MAFEVSGVSLHPARSCWNLGSIELFELASGFHVSRLVRDCLCRLLLQPACVAWESRLLQRPRPLALPDVGTTSELAEQRGMACSFLFCPHTTNYPNLSRKPIPAAPTAASVSLCVCARACPGKSTIQFIKDMSVVIARDGAQLIAMTMRWWWRHWGWWW